MYLLKVLFEKAEENSLMRTLKLKKEISSHTVVALVDM